MQRVHDVVCVKRRGRRLVHVLAPRRRAHDDDGIGVVRANDGDDALGTRLHVFPGGAVVWFVANLVDDVVVPRQVGRDAPEESRSLVGVRKRVGIAEHVPVHDGVQVGFGGERNAVAHPAKHPATTSATATSAARTTSQKRLLISKFMLNLPFPFPSSERADGWDVDADWLVRRYSAVSTFALARILLFCILSATSVVV